jgi:hypothetical protein
MMIVAELAPHRRENKREGSSMAGSDGSSTGGRKRKRKSHPTSKARNQRQKAKRKYAKARESASASGVVAISPEGPSETSAFKRQ